MKVLALVLASLPVTLAAQENQLARGTLDIQMARSGMVLSLAVPERDILGFDLPAADDTQRARVATAISDLSEPLKLFVPGPEAGCVTASANVAIVEAQGARAEIQAEYQIRCTRIDAANKIRFDFFKRFEHAKALTVNVRSDLRNRSFDVSRDRPVAELNTES